MRRSGLRICAAVGLSLSLAGPLPAEEFQYPVSVTAAAEGSVYVADRNLPGIWKIADGKAEVFFQASKKFRTPLNAVRAVALDGKGRLLAADSATRDIYRFDEKGQPVPLTKGGIGIPMDVAANAAGELFVSDLEAHRIWKVPADGGEPQEFVVLAAPRGLFMDEDDRLWAVADNGLRRIASDGKVETIVEKGTFEFPHDVVVIDGTAYVSDNYAHALWKVGPGGKAEKWITGDPLQGPVGLGRQGDRLLVADPKARAIFTVETSGKISKLAPGP